MGLSGFDKEIGCNLRNFSIYAISDEVLVLFLAKNYEVLWEGGSQKGFLCFAAPLRGGSSCGLIKSHGSTLEKS